MSIPSRAVIGPFGGRTDKPCAFAILRSSLRGLGRVFELAVGDGGGSSLTMIFGAEFLLDIGDRLESGVLVGAMASCDPADILVGVEVEEALGVIGAKVE
jgi:hypothetical protein